MALCVVALGFQVWAFVWTLMNPCSSTLFWIWSVINFSCFILFLVVLLFWFLVTFIVSVIKSLPKREKKPKEEEKEEGEGEESEGNDDPNNSH